MRGSRVAAQRKLDEYLMKPQTPRIMMGKPRREDAGGTTEIRELLLCLRPEPRPRSILLCKSHRDLKESCDADYVVLDIHEAAMIVCKGALATGKAVAIEIDGRRLANRAARLLLFWTIRSIPRRLQVALIIPGLVQRLERAAKSGETVRPPAEWSWLVTSIYEKIGACWEAFV